MDCDRVSHCDQPHSLSLNAMQFEQHSWSVTRYEVVYFYLKYELGCLSLSASFSTYA